MIVEHETWMYIHCTPCTGKYHESVAVLCMPRVPQARVAIQQQTSDIASTRYVICLSHRYHIVRFMGPR